MTSTIIIDASRAPEDPPSAGARPSAPRTAVRLGFGGVVRSEWIKLASLRSIRLTVLITVLAGLGLSGLMALLWSAEVASGGTELFGSGPEAAQGYLLFVATFAAPFLALVFGVLGVFAISSEYSSGMILSTLAAVPRRSPVFVAKGLVLALVSAAAAAILVAGGLGLAVAFMPDAAAQLGSVAVVTGALGTVAYLTLVALLAFGVAALLRSTAGGIAVVAGITFVLPIVAQVLALTGWEWVPAAAAYLPVELGARLSQGAAGAQVDGPGYAAALLALAAWAAAAVLPAALAFQRRDAK